MEHEIITEAALDILAVFRHPSEERYDELLEALTGRLRRLLNDSGATSSPGLRLPRPKP